MKLQDALKKIIREFGMSVLKEKRLVSILADYKAFDDYPAARQVMKSIVEGGYGKELCRLGMDGSSEECLGYAGLLKKALSVDKNFNSELADYAVDCILSAMGLVTPVREPSEHGFDPFGNGPGSRGQVERLTSSAGTAAPDDSEGMLSDSRTAPVETSSSAPATDKIQIQLPPHAGGTSPLGNKVNGTGSSCAQASAIDSSAQLTKSTGTATSNACGSKAGQQNSRSINASSVIVAIIVSLIWALICGSLLNCVLTGVLGLDTLTKIFGSHTDVFYELIYVITFVISYLIICGSWKRDAG